MAEFDLVAWGAAAPRCILQKEDMERLVRVADRAAATHRPVDATPKQRQAIEDTTRWCFVVGYMLCRLLPEFHQELVRGIRAARSRRVRSATADDPIIRWLAHRLRNHPISNVNLLKYDDQGPELAMKFALECVLVWLGVRISAGKPANGFAFAALLVDAAGDMRDVEVHVQAARTTFPTQMQHDYRAAVDVRVDQQLRTIYSDDLASAGVFSGAWRGEAGGVERLVLNMADQHAFAHRFGNHSRAYNSFGAPKGIRDADSVYAENPRDAAVHLCFEYVPVDNAAELTLAYDGDTDGEDEQPSQSVVGGKFDAHRKAAPDVIAAADGAVASDAASNDSDVEITGERKGGVVVDFSREDDAVRADARMWATAEDLPQIASSLALSLAAKFQSADYAWPAEVTAVEGLVDTDQSHALWLVDLVVALRWWCTAIDADIEHAYGMFLVARLRAFHVLNALKDTDLVFKPCTVAHTARDKRVHRIEMTPAAFDKMLREFCNKMRPDHEDVRYLQIKRDKNRLALLDMTYRCAFYIPYFSLTVVDLNRAYAHLKRVEDVLLEHNRERQRDAEAAAAAAAERGDSLALRRGMADAEA